MARNGNLEDASGGVADRGVAQGPTAAQVSRALAADTGSPQAGVRSTSLQLRIAAGFAAMTLAIALMIGIIAERILSDIGLSATLAAEIRQQLLLWGFGAVVVSSLLGALFALQISEPLRKLTDDLRHKDLRDLADSSNVRREFLELEQLSLTIHALATSVHNRDVELSASERKFREAFDFVGIGLTQVDTEGRFLAVNRRFCDMLGYTAEELKGKRFIEITHPEDQAADEAMVQAIVSNGLASPVSREKRYIRKDGSVLWAQRSGVVVRDAAGKPLYALGSIEDVSN